MHFHAYHSFPALWSPISLGRSRLRSAADRRRRRAGRASPSSEQSGSTRPCRCTKREPHHASLGDVRVQRNEASGSGARRAAKDARKSACADARCWFFSSLAHHLPRYHITLRLSSTGLYSTFKKGTDGALLQQFVSKVDEGTGR